jgi:hypothetical protein
VWPGTQETATGISTWPLMLMIRLNATTARSHADVFDLSMNSPVTNFMAAVKATDCDCFRATEIFLV